MAESYIWGNLARATNDATLIDEAIGQAVSAHNDNPDAHLEAGQALQSHRAAEVIDHLAESVVNDKIRAGARTYAAIVGNEDGDDYDNLPDAIAYVWGLGGGSIKLRRGTYSVTDELKVRYGVDIYGEGPAETVIECDFSGLSYGAHVFNFADVHDLAARIVPSIGFESGEQACWIDWPGTVEPQWLDNVYYDGIETEAGSDGYFSWDVAGNRLLLRDLATESGVVEPSSFVLTITSNVASKVVHLNGWQLAGDLLAYEGLKLDTEDGYLGTINAYLGNGDFELGANALYTAEMARNPVVSGQEGRMSVVQGVTIRALNARSTICSQETRGRFFVRDCNLEVGTALCTRTSYEPNGYSGNGRFEDCIITYMNGSVDDCLKNMTFDNCQFIYHDISTVTTMGGEDAYFYACLFRIDGTTPGGVCSSIDLGSLFEDCIFDGIFNGTVGWRYSYGMNGRKSGIVMRGCIFSKNWGNYTAAAIKFNISYSVFTELTIKTGNVAHGLHTSARKSILTNSIVYGSLAAQPTQCLVSNNIVWTT